MSAQTDPTSEVDRVIDVREAARRRVQAKRDFGSHLVAYIVVNAFLVGLLGHHWSRLLLAGLGSGLLGRRAGIARMGRLLAPASHRRRRQRGTTPPPPLRPTRQT